MYDLRLTGATVIDGTGASGDRADVGVADGRIVGVGHDFEGPAACTVDRDGLVLAPGFIDLHTHVDFTLPRYPRAAAMVRQGVTTLVSGNCAGRRCVRTVDRPGLRTRFACRSRRDRRPGGGRCRARALLRLAHPQ